MNKKKKILLVEDDESMGFLLKDSLESHGFSVSHFPDGKSALAEFYNRKFDLCLIDVMMPIMDGFSLAKEIRQCNVDIPIVFLTAKSLKEDKIKGFKLGADDYITKPFIAEELILRINAILKRGKVLEPNMELISFLNYTLDNQNFTLNIADKSIKLSKKETDILAILVANQNKTLKREVILKSVWKDNSYFVSRSLDVYISKLRKLFKEDSRINIRTIHGAGYRLEFI